MARIRLGIIGVGRHGSRYARHAARDIDDIELVAVCRRNTRCGRKLADSLECDYERDARDLITRPDIDAVVLVTIPRFLEQLVELAVQYGKHLLIEKPVAPDFDTGQRIAEMVEGSRIVCMAGHTLRFNSVCQRLRDVIPELGRIDSLVFSQRFPPQLDTAWLDDPAQAGGGNVLHTGVHCFDLIGFFTGLEPMTATCITRKIHTKRTEDSFTAAFSFSHANTVASVSCSRTTDSRNGLIEISGERGQLIGDHVLNELYRLGPSGRGSVDPGPPKHTVFEILRCFAADLLLGREPTISYRDGLAAVAVADACYRSAASARHEAVVIPRRGT